MEAKVTAEYMLQYGINNVRGAMFAQPENFTMAKLDSLTGFIGHYNDLDYKVVRNELKNNLVDPENNSLYQLSPFKYYRSKFDKKK